MGFCQVGMTSVNLAMLISILLRSTYFRSSSFLFRDVYGNLEHVLHFLCASWAFTQGSNISPQNVNRLEHAKQICLKFKHHVKSVFFGTLLLPVSG